MTFKQGAHRELSASSEERTLRPELALARPPDPPSPEGLKAHPLRIWFTAVRKGSIHDGDGILFSTTDWNITEFQDFKRKACELATRIWNEKIWLKTPSYFAGLDWPDKDPTHRPNVHCGLRVVEARGPGDAHATVEAVHWEPRLPTEMEPRPKGFRSFATRWGHDTIVEREHPIALDSGITQITAAHEVGHLLGLDHVGRILRINACMDQPDANSDPCYGKGANAGGPEVARNVMGIGNEIKDYNAAPWQTRMAEHTKGATEGIHWVASTKRFPPVALKQTPSEPRQRAIYTIP